MTARQRDELHQELIHRLTRIYRMVRADLSADIIAQAIAPDPTDEAEEGALDELDALSSQLDERERHAVHALEDALRRMRSDDFGICIDCGREIPFERLLVVPSALRCADDQTRIEQGAHSPSL